MSEMSIIQQIELVQEMKDYIRSVVTETDIMREEVNSIISYLRREGLPMEVADHFMGPLYMGHVNCKLDVLLDHICNEDYKYLEDIQQRLEDIARY